MIELSFDSDNSILWYLTSHSDAATPVGASVIPSVVEGMSGTSQELNPDTANSSIGKISFNLVDKASIVTDTLGDQISLGRSTRRQRVRVYVGFEGLEWEDYTLVQTQLVTQIDFENGLYKFSCADIQREMRKDLFELGKTTLAQSLTASATVIEVVSTAAFNTVFHGDSYSDAAGSEVGYLKIQDEIIRYTAKTSTQFSGCTRGALNTKAIEHAVDLSAAEDRRTPVEEYVYLEMPSAKTIYSLLTGCLTHKLTLPGLAGAYASTPDSAIVSITGDIDIRLKVTALDWTPSTNTSMHSKWGSGGTSWAFRHTAAGGLDFFWNDGVQRSVTSSVGHSFIDASTHWVGVALDVDNGAGGHVVRFYTSSDGITWTQLGTDRNAGAFTTSIVNTTQAINLSGITDGGSQHFSGSIHYAELRNGINGEIVSCFNPIECPIGETSFKSNKTGETWSIHGSAEIEGDKFLPDSWNLGIDPSYVRLTDFTDVSKKDLWDTNDESQGFITRFEGLEKVDGKKFIESELALLTGTFMPIYADGALGFRRMSNILAGAPYVKILDDTNLVKVGPLVHDFESLHNVLQLNWNWELARKDFTRVNLLIDANSVTVHGKGDPLKFKFRGLHGSRHSSTILAQRFDGIRDRFTSPPLRIQVSVLPSLNVLEVGDVVRLKPSNVRDFVANGLLDRSFEIQNISINWITGDLTLSLFGSTQAPGAIPPTADTTVLTDAWYTSEGTPLSSVVTITGSNPGHVTAGGTLTGKTDLNHDDAIYYYDGDLTIDAGVTINITENVQLRIKGFLQNNGTINGRGNGIVGAAALGSVTGPGQFNAGTPGFIGSPIAGGGVQHYPHPSQLNVVSYPGAAVTGANVSVPAFNLTWDGTTLSGLPQDLRGSSGSSGMPAEVKPIRFITFSHGGSHYAGGAGGDGGAGLVIISRGLAQGVAGEIDLSGGDGSAGVTTTNMEALLGSSAAFDLTLHAGSGAGGAPGGLLVLLDGALVQATGLTETGFVAEYGDAPITGDPRSSVEGPPLVEGEHVYSHYVGNGDGSTFPIPSLSGGRGGSRVQHVPSDEDAAPDLGLVTLAPPTNFGLTAGAAELQVMTDGHINTRVKVTWTPALDPEVLAYDIQVKPSSESVWVSIPTVFGQLEDTVFFVVTKDGVNWDVRIRSAGSERRVSNWATIEDFFVEGKSAPPSNVGTLFFTDPILSWSEITDADRRGYVVRYNAGVDTTWETATPAHEEGFITETQFDTGRIVGGVTTLLVKAIDTSGNLSTAATSLQVDLRPVAVTSFSITRQPDGTREFNWDTLSPPSDLDGIRIRYFLGTTADWNAMTALHEGVLKASPFETNQLAAGTYTFAAKNVDKSGNESASAIFITTVTIGDPRIAGAIEDIREEPDWTGTKTDCLVDIATGWLEAVGLATWTTLPATWTLWTQWNHTPDSPIVYEKLIDIGLKLQFIPLITVSVDGTPVIEEQHSDDGSSYSSYAVVGPQIDARYIRIRVTVTGSYPKIKTMRTILSASPVSEIVEDQDSAALAGSYRIGTGDVRVPIVKTYSIVKKVDISLQSVGAGWTWELVDKDETVGPRIRIYNASNVLADAVFDATVTGI